MHVCDREQESYGTIYQFTNSGSFATVHTFCQNVVNGYCDDGNEPFSNLFAASDGNFYGTTSGGGTGANGSGGTAFQFTTGGKFTTTYNFCELSSCADGRNPIAGLLQGSDGTFYGNTDLGGVPEEGNLFQLVPKPALAAPVQIALSESSVPANTAVALSWKSLNAFSLTMQQCYAFVQAGTPGAGTWTGKQSGTYSFSTKLFTGSASVIPTAAGSYTYALTCGGVESGFAILTVTDSSKDTTATTLAASPNPVTEGQSIKLSAQVTRTSGSGVPAGKVAFKAGSDTLATVSLNSSGVASVTGSTTPYLGNYSLVADYLGDTDDTASTSPAITVTIQAPTTTAFTVTPVTVTVGEKITFKATVSAIKGGTPTGKVIFQFGSHHLVAANLSGGIASVTFNVPETYPAGTYPITADYQGDATQSPSTSTAVIVKLNN
jgi:hypothetical protein